MNEAAMRAVACPKCRTKNQVQAGFVGVVRCTKCGGGLRIGAKSETQHRNLQARDAADSRTATRVIVIFAVVGVLLAILIFSSKGKGVDPTPPAVPRSDPSRAAPSAPTPEREVLPPTTRVEEAAKRFIKALASRDRAALDQIFDYRQHFAKAALKYKWEDARRYENQTAEQQAAMRDEAASLLMSADRCDHLRDYFVAKLDAGTVKPTDASVKDDYGTFDYAVPNDTGETAFLLRVMVGLRDGFDKKTDRENPAAWGVYELADQWKITTVGRKKDRGFKEAVEERKIEETIVARKGGPPEEAPALLPPLPGTSEGQAAGIKRAIASLVNPTAPAKEFQGARTTLQDAGKVAIPFMLNELVGKDHRDNEAHRNASAAIVRELIEITGAEIPYGPMNTDQAAFGMVSMTPDEREQAVRRWFGWWKTKGPKFEKKVVQPDPLDEEDPTKKPAPKPAPKPPKRT